MKNVVERCRWVGVKKKKSEFRLKLDAVLTYLLIVPRSVIFLFHAAACNLRVCCPWSVDDYENYCTVYKH